jgi:hypothetical protein
VAIGNPPYIDSELMTVYLGNWRAYCTKHYISASGNWDIFCVFVEKTLDILRPGGLASLIVPNKLGSADYAAGARRALTEDQTLLSIRDYSAVKVFPVAVYPIVYVASKRKAQKQPPVRYERMMARDDGSIVCVKERMLDYGECFADPSRPWRMFADSEQPNPFDRIRRSCPALGAVATVLGAATVSEAYKLKPLLAEQRGHTGGLKVVNSGLIDRYVTLWSVRPCRYIKSSYEQPVIPASAVSRLPAKRRQQAHTPKIVVSGMTKVIECFIDHDGEWLAAKSTTIVLDSSVDLRYLGVLLNSKLITYYFLSEYGGNRLQGGYLRIGPPQIKTIPIRIPDNRESKIWHDTLVDLGNKLTTTLRRLQTPGSPHAKHALEGTTSALEQQIDGLVYRLYGLSDEEITVVEAAYATACGVAARDISSRRATLHLLPDDLS